MVSNPNLVVRDRGRRQRSRMVSRLAYLLFASAAAVTGCANAAPSPSKVAGTPIPAFVRLVDQIKKPGIEAGTTVVAVAVRGDLGDVAYLTFSAIQEFDDPRACWDSQNPGSDPATFPPYFNVATALDRLSPDAIPPVLGKPLFEAYQLDKQDLGGSTTAFEGWVSWRVRSWTSPCSYHLHIKWFVDGRGILYPLADFDIP